MADGSVKGSVPSLMTSKIRQREEAEHDGPQSPHPNQGNVSGTPGTFHQLRVAKVLDSHQLAVNGVIYSGNTSCKSVNQNLPHLGRQLTDL